MVKSPFGASYGDRADDVFDRAAIKDGRGSVADNIIKQIAGRRSVEEYCSMMLHKLPTLPLLPISYRGA